MGTLMLDDTLDPGMLELAGQLRDLARLQRALEAKPPAQPKPCDRCTPDRPCWVHETYEFRKARMSP